MPTQINGLPAHVLLIHVIVVLVPLGALCTVLTAVWPAAHRKLGVISPLICLVVVALVPVTTNAGEWLEDKLQQNGENPAIEKHADLGGTFLWYALLLFAVSATVWWLGRTYQFGLIGTTSTEPAGTETSTSGGGGTATATRTEAQKQALPTAASIAIAVVSVVVALLVGWQLYRIGDSGAHAAWDYVQDLKGS